MAFKLGMTVDLCMENNFMYVHLIFDDLDLDAKSQWVGKGKTISVELSRQLSKQYPTKLATTVCHLFLYVTLTLKTFIWHDHFVCFFFVVPMGIVPIENSGRFASGKPAVTESHYPAIIKY